MGILDQIFRRKVKPTETSEMSPNTAMEIIQRYGAVLEHNAPAPGCVADSAKLPYRKDQIKEALIFGLGATNDPQIREFLKVGYLQLADWQDGVGDSDVGLDFTGLDPKSDIEKFAQSVVSQGDALEKWQPIVAAELDTLKKDLIELGVWDGEVT